MERRIHYCRWRLCLTCLAMVACFISCAFQHANGADDEVDSSTVQTESLNIEDRLRDLERSQELLIEENQRLSFQVDEFQKRLSATEPDLGSIPQPLISEKPWHEVGYSKGILLATRDSDQLPFELKFNNQAQMRYAGFARGVDTWTDSTGSNLPVTNRSAFELVRGRAIFSGHAFSKQLGYNLSLDYTTVSDSQINFWNYWLSYEFNRSVTLFIGQAAVPGSREWLTAPVYTVSPDYTLATTFFRPSLSQGMWATGQPIDGVYYRAMFSNGFNTLGTSQDRLDSRMTFSGSIWAEPFDEFGPGFSDFEWHDDPSIRMGTSFSVSPNEGQQGNPNLPENSDIRLTNGTLLTQMGAITPGVTLNQYTIALNAFDFGWKYRGISLNGEIFLRDLFGLRGDGPISRSSIVDYGGYFQLGYFVLPQKFELYSRTSQILGAYGSGAEYAGGLNWYFLKGKQNLRFTFDAAWVVQSPADQARTDYHAGDTGLLVRSQIQFFF